MQTEQAYLTIISQLTANLVGHPNFVKTHTLLLYQ